MADGGSERADGRIVKMEVDYSATVDQRLPECEQLAKVRQPPGAESRRGPPRPRGARGPERASPGCVSTLSAGAGRDLFLTYCRSSWLFRAGLAAIPGEGEWTPRCTRAPRPGCQGVATHGPRSWPLAAITFGFGKESILIFFLFKKEKKKKLFTKTTRRRGRPTHLCQILPAYLPGSVGGLSILVSSPSWEEGDRG